jgi:monofunctional biosynthetic peptidoglycan transglycosylase
LFASLAVLITGAATAIPILLFASLAPPTTAFMIASRFADPATGKPCVAVEYEWLDFESISPHLGLAVIVAEDQRFFAHEGFDVNAINRALTDHSRGGRLRGASTISQQVAKNLFLWPNRSLIRKSLEAWFTAWLERAWSKRRILEVYLNVAQFGPCVFGAGAASRHYFDADAIALEPDQAALLAAVLPSPRRLRAHDPGPYTRQRSAEIREMMKWHQGRAIGHQLDQLSDANRNSRAPQRGAILTSRFAVALPRKQASNSAGCAAAPLERRRQSSVGTPVDSFHRHASEQHPRSNI